MRRRRKYPRLESRSDLVHHVLWAVYCMAWLPVAASSEDPETAIAFLALAVYWLYRVETWTLYEPWSDNA